MELSDVDGLVVVGTWVGINEQEGGAVAVVERRRYDGQTFNQSLIFSDYDRSSGEQTAASMELRGCEPGARVAVRVTPAVSRAGKPFLRAVGVVELEKTEGTRRARKLPGA